MRDEAKRKEELESELTRLRQRIAELEQAESEREQAEQKVWEQVHFLETLFDTIPSPIFLKDANGRYTVTNRAFLEFIGRPREEVLGQSVYEMGPKDIADQYAEKDRELFEHPGKQHYEWLVQNAQGELRNVVFDKATLLDAHGVPTGLIGVISDITRRKQAEAALRQSEESLRAILNAVTESVFMIDLEGTVLSANKNTAKRLGAEIEDLIGRCIYDLLPPDVAVSRKQHLNTVLQSGRPVQFEDERKGRWYEHSVYPILDEESNITRFAVFGRDVTEQKRSEERLTRLLERLDMATRAARMGIWDWDIQNNELVWDDRMYELYGVERQNFRSVYDAWLAGVHPDDRAASDEVSRQALLGEREYETEFRIVRPDGTVRVLKAYGQVIRDAEGKPLRMTGVNYDITEHKQADEALRTQEERLRLAMEATQQGWFDLNVQTGEVTVSEEYARIIGHAPAEFSANLQGWIGGIHPTDRDAVLKAFRECLETGDTRTMEYRRQTKTGEWKWIRSIGKIVGFDSQKKPLRMTGTHADISERKRAEEALKESQERFQELAELLPETIFEMDTSGNLTFVNRNAFGHFGISEEDFKLGLNAFDMVSPEDRPRALENAEKAMRGEKLGLNEYKALRKDGSTFPIIMHSAAKFRDGKPIGLRGVVIDVTETKKLEAQLRQAHKMEAIGTLAGGIAHDFNNILAAIIGYTEMALTDLSKTGSARHYLGQVLKAGHRAKDLVKQILASSRQKQSQERVPVEIAAVIKEALNLLRPSLPATVEIRQNIGSETGMAFADPTEIHQVLVNLCTNAAHAMEEHGGVLELSLGEVALDSETVAAPSGLNPGPYLCLTVSDTGHGIDPAVLERIFDPYFTTKEVGRGSGLGLAVVHGIVKRHEGAVTVNSEPGMGTSFHVYLPKVESLAGNEVDEVEEPFPQGKERILFVDDEGILVEMGKSVLEWLGYEVSGTTSSIEALELFRTRPDRFDVVITDYTMPYMTGVDLAKEMMGVRPDIPVILCTGFSEKITKEKAANIGIRAFAMKPLNMREIAEVVREVLDKTKG